jgi:hypothetical protein
LTVTDPLVSLTPLLGFFTPPRLQRVGGLRQSFNAIGNSLNY